ncbi:hypothetical protein CAT59_17255 [Acinetobacter pittii]|jgi:hypothetical protein|uniref:Uncharacterized protein n=1 Tax=Acinetobacter pittii TaxID=48296 RepID=A0A242U1H9_ACIPI|nr:hypothetical protein CAT59_17255 [Acinetobacter pittii]
MLFYNIPIETLNSFYNNKFEDLEIKSLDEKTKVLFTKYYVEIKKDPKVLLKILFLINKFENLEV